MGTISCTKQIKTILDFLSCSLQHTLINGGNDISDPLL